MHFECLTFNVTFRAIHDVIQRIQYIVNVSNFELSNGSLAETDLR